MKSEFSRIGKEGGIHTVCKGIAIGECLAIDEIEC